VLRFRLNAPRTNAAGRFSMHFGLKTYRHTKIKMNRLRSIFLEDITRFARRAGKYPLVDGNETPLTPETWTIRTETGHRSRRLGRVGLRYKHLLFFSPRQRIADTDRRRTGTGDTDNDGFSRPRRRREGRRRIDTDTIRGRARLIRTGECAPAGRPACREGGF